MPRRWRPATPRHCWPPPSAWRSSTPCSSPSRRPAPPKRPTPKRGARPPTLLATPEAADLTPREREIALLAAAGSSSREIADRLVVSVRTVDNHLHNAYRKLGVTRRQDLAR